MKLNYFDFNYLNKDPNSDQRILKQVYHLISFDRFIDKFRVSVDFIKLIPLEQK